MDEASTRRILRWLRAPIIALLAAILANYGLLRVDWIGYLELSTFQRRVVALCPAPASRDIVLVVIDQTTMEKLGLPQEHRSLRWLRSRHARLINVLRQAGARSLVIDVIFDTPHVKVEDEPLREALAESRPMAITLAADRSRVEKSPDLPGGYAYWFNRPAILPQPCPENVSVGAAVAFDPDLRLAGVRLLFDNQASGRTIPHLSLGGCLKPTEHPIWDRRRGTVTAGTHEWPVGQDGELHIRWTPHLGMFRILEYSDALTRTQGFRNKVVLLGVEDDLDHHTTVLGEMAGYEFIAQAINTLLLPANEQVRRCRIPCNLAWAWGLALLAAGFIRTRRARFVGPLLAVLMGLLMPVVLLRYRLIWLDTVGPLLAVAISLSVAAMLETAVVGDLARRFAPRLAWQGRPARLTEEATTLFADMSGYTRIAEDLHPHEVQRLQKELLAVLSSSVKRHQGEVERTIGDSIMAVFRGRRHAVKAAQTALSLLSQFEAFKDTHGLEGLRTTALRIGLESGVISTGLIEFADREDYSSAGHAVNLASRLQGACESQGLNVLLGPAAYALIGDEMPMAFVGSVALKNVKDPTPVYTLKDAGVRHGTYR
jgi:adenylate cyclase